MMYLRINLYYKIWFQKIFYNNINFVWHFSRTVAALINMWLVLSISLAQKWFLCQFFFILNFLKKTHNGSLKKRRFQEMEFFVGYLNWRNSRNLQLTHQHLQFSKVTPVQITYKQSLFVKFSKQFVLVIHCAFFQKNFKINEN